MASVNKVILVGNVGKDPEVRYLDSVVAVATITLATSERGYTLANGTQVPERSEWHNVVVWKGSAEYAEKYVKKGSQLYVEGKITTKTWEKDGITRYKTEIVAENIQLLGKKPESQQESQYTDGLPRNNQGTGLGGPAQQAAFPGQEGTDDLPF